MADGNMVTVADRILQLLGSSGMLEVAMLLGASDEFDRLKDTIEGVRAQLIGAEDQPADKVRESALGRLETALYHADDLLDEIFTVVSQRRDMSGAKKVCAFFSVTTSNPLVFKRKTCYRLKKVRETITEITKEIPFVGKEIGERPTRAIGRDLGRRERETHSYVIGSEVIGRDGERQEMVANLLEDNLEENVLVIPIVGIGGLGKTTLAQLIFNDDMVQSHFDLKIWVCVSDVFDLRVILEKIIPFITTKNPENGLALHKLENLIRQNIRGNKYLLVLDDVWNEDAEKWSTLKALLSFGENGSRIIVTTRSEIVAKITGDKQPFVLTTLDDDQSWSLFKRVALGGGRESAEPRSIEIGKHIVKKCGGIPLVIRAIGSILYHKDPETEWHSFYNEELSNILAEEEDTVLASLRLSYDALSPPLKECFAYCGLFPKDYEIDVETLVTLWMSQGFIVQNSGHLEEMGYDYFHDLRRRSFFQETRRDEWAKIETCKMQNLMHDLARSVAANACATLGLKCESFVGKPRHISLDFHLDSSWQIPIWLAELKRIRTLILPGQLQWECEMRSSELSCDGFMKFKFLRMLDLHNSGIKVLPKSIGELKHLRYLDLSQNGNIKTLPNSISRLRNLQTLKLSHCSNLQTLPRDIKKLVNLRNLENESCYCLTRMPRGLRQLSNLRTLSEFVLSKGTGSVSNKSGRLDELKELHHLRGKLKIKNLRFWEDDKTAEASLYNKHGLRSLVLIWDIDAAVDPSDFEKSLEDLRPPPNLRELSFAAYGGVQFSSWFQSLSCLIKFSLSNCIRCQCLPPLDHLPLLKVLILDKLTNLEYISGKTFRIESRSIFPYLEELRLTNLPKLERWWKDATENIEETAFPRLSKLVVEDCPNLTSMPLFPCLEELLVLKNTSWKPLQQTMAAETRTSRNI